MIPAAAQHGKRVALFGLGGSGLATARALAAGGADIVVFDDNPQKVGQARAEGLSAADFRERGLAGFDMLVLSPGVPLTHPRPHWAAELATAAGVEIVGDIELFARERRAAGADCPFVAITGTNGKSTTTALTAHVLREAGLDVQMGGNIGVPVLSLEPPAPGRAYVVECSSYQIDLAPSLDPTVGILLNLTPDHLDRHGSMERYAAVKERLAANSANAVIGCDDEWCRAIAQRLEKSVAVYGISAAGPCAGRGRSFHADGTVLMFAGGNPAARVIGDIGGIGSLRGAHNVQNALAALAAATIAAPDLPWERHVEAMRSFPGLAHRMEQVARIGRVLFVNDSKATNADAAEKALSSYPRVYWIAGGLAKEGGIAPLAPYFPRVARAYLIGEAAPQFAATIGAAAPFVISQTVEAAVAQAAADAADDPAAEPVVLLSPACASFDQFQNFEKRGDAFRQAVLALPGASPAVPPDQRK